MLFSDVEQNGWIQPYKSVYTMHDFNKLNKEHNELTSRFILVCSAAYYDISENKNVRISKSLEKKFRAIMNRD